MKTCSYVNWSFLTGFRKGLLRLEVHDMFLVSVNNDNLVSVTYSTIIAALVTTTPGAKPGTKGKGRRKGKVCWRSQSVSRFSSVSKSISDSSGDQEPNSSKTESW
jgi:hypothetical protein